MSLDVVSLAPDATQVGLIREGIRDLVDSTKVNGRQCIDIIPRTSETAYVFIQKFSGYVIQALVSFTVLTTTCNVVIYGSHNNLQRCHLRFSQQLATWSFTVLTTTCNVVIYGAHRRKMYRAFISEAPSENTQFSALETDYCLI
jgi:hypothetical protein